MQKFWLKTYQGREKDCISPAAMLDPSWEMKESHQKSLFGQNISYFGSENDHILLIFMGHMQNNICILSSSENICFLMVFLFVISLISVLLLGFRLQNQLERHQNSHFFLTFKNKKMGHIKLAFWKAFGNMNIRSSIWP